MENRESLWVSCNEIEDVSFIKNQLKEDRQRITMCSSEMCVIQ